jgi:hypothetical protein
LRTADIAEGGRSNSAARDATVTTGLSDDALENVIVGLRIARRVGRLNGEGGAELPQEHAIVGAFLSAHTALPAPHKFLYCRRHGRSRMRRRLLSRPHALEDTA